MLKIGLLCLAHPCLALPSAVLLCFQLPCPKLPCIAWRCLLLRCAGLFRFALHCPFLYTDLPCLFFRCPLLLVLLYTALRYPSFLPVPCLVLSNFGLPFLRCAALLSLTCLAVPYPTFHCATLPASPSLAQPCPFRFPACVF